MVFTDDKSWAGSQFKVAIWAMGFYQWFSAPGRFSSTWSRWARSRSKQRSERFWVNGQSHTLQTVSTAVSCWNDLVSNYFQTMLSHLKLLSPFCGCSSVVPGLFHLLDRACALGVGSGTQHPELWNMAVSRFKPFIGVLSSKCLFSHIQPLEFWRERWKEIKWFLLWILFTNQCLLHVISYINNGSWAFSRGLSQNGVPSKASISSGYIIINHWLRGTHLSDI